MVQPSSGADALAALVGIARDHADAGRAKQAVVVLEAVLKAAPQHAGALHQLGMLLVAEGKIEGLHRITAAARLTPDDLDRQADLADAFDALGLEGKVPGRFRGLLAQAPTREDFMVRFARTLARAKRYEAAERWARRALCLSRGHERAETMLGAILHCAGRVDEAIAIFSHWFGADRGAVDGSVALAGLLEAAAELELPPRRSPDGAKPRPHTAEASGSVVHLFHYLRDIGKEDESIRIATPLVLRQMEKAAKDEIGGYGIRVLQPDNLIERIGEVIVLLDLHVKMKIMGWLPPFVSILLAPRERTANATIIDYYRPYVTVVDDPRLIAMMEPLKDRVPFDPSWVRLPDGRVISKARAYYAAQAEWLRQGRGPLLSLTQAHAERGRQGLRRLGVPDGAWFACVHVREAGYTKEGPASPEAIRNASIAAYLPAVEEIVRRGGWVIRLGDPTMTPLPPLPQVIDYAVSPLRSEEMDIFLMASCRFMLGTTSGPVVVSEAFGVPVGAADFFPSGGILHTPNDVIIPKPYREKATGRLLYFDEYLKMPLAFIYDSPHFVSLGLEAVPSEPEDIVDLAIEMLERTEGKWPYDAEDEKLNARWFELSRSFSLGDTGCRIGRGFLRRHRHLFRSV